VKRFACTLACTSLLTVTVVNAAPPPPPPKQQAQVVAEVNQSPVPAFEPGEVVIGVASAGTDVFLFTTRYSYTAPSYSGSALGLSQALDGFGAMGIVLSARSRVALGLASSPADRVFYLTGLSNVLYTLKLPSGSFPVVDVAPVQGFGGRPNGIAVNSLGTVYLLCNVCVIGSDNVPHVATIDPGTGITSAPFGISGAGTLINPTAIAIGPTNFVYVLDAGDATIKSYDATGVYMGSFPVAYPGELSSESAMTVGPDHRIYVNPPYVSVYNALTGAFLGRIDQSTDQGINPNPNGHPAITLDSNGFVYDVTGSGQYVHVLDDVTVPRLRELTLSLKNQTVGGTLTGTVTLESAAPGGGASVALTSSDLGVAIPSTVTVAAGAKSATFTLAVGALPTTNPVTISASYAGITKARTLTVLALTLKDLTLAPATVKGGTASTGTVTLNGPAPFGGVSIPLTSSNAAASVPATVDVPEGASSAPFSITTNAVTKNTNAQIGASYGGVTKSKPLTVTK
jgi:hypothetical protein